MGRKKKKRYVEDHIFHIYPDYPLMILNRVGWGKEGAMAPMHYHYYLEIGLCHEGEGQIITENADKQFQSGSVTLIAPNLLHATRSSNDSYNKWSYLFIDLEDFIKLYSFTDEQLERKILRELFYEIQILDTKEYPIIGQILQIIPDLHDGKQGRYKEQILGLISTLLFLFYDCLTNGPEQFPESPDLAITPAIDHIYNHYMDPIRTSDLSALCHFSESHFRKVFLDMKGISPMEYLNSIRIREACWMLQNTTKNIRNIGEECGYQSFSSFERNFKSRMGMLPSQWRNERKIHRKKESTEFEIKKIYTEP